MGLLPSERFPLEEPYTSRCLLPSWRYLPNCWPAARERHRDRSNPRHRSADGTARSRHATDLTAVRRPAEGPTTRVGPARSAQRRPRLRTARGWTVSWAVAAASRGRHHRRNQPRKTTPKSGPRRRSQMVIPVATRRRPKSRTSQGPTRRD